jgi:ATP-dependent DNA ligase
VSRKRWLLFAFDLFELGGKGLRRIPLEDRERALAKLLRNPHGHSG